MKLTVLFLFVGLMQVSASLYSQNTKLSLDFRNTRVVDVLEAIENQSEFRFAYSAEYIDMNRKVDVDVKGSSIEQTLSLIFAGTDVKYSINDRHIMLFREGMLPNASQQQKSVSGKVTDSTGAGLPGVSVVVKGTTTGVITDMDGKYTLAKVPENATLVFSFVGMKSQEVAVGAKTVINVTLAEETVGIDEVVAVGYGTQKRGNLTGSISSVKNEKLTVAPVASTSNSLAGRLPGLVSVQSSGQPGADAASLSIRGFGNALVIVDGVESSFNNIDATQIESVSILKDGAASIYGARAGNGVILVTTKRGQDQKPTITLNSSFTLQGVTAMLKPASSGQQATMEREAWLNAGKPEGNAPWTTDQVQKFFDGNDWLYPNTNWYNELMRDYAPQQQHNLSVRGGSDKIKYYGFIGYLDQETMIKNNGGVYQRYNVQSNIDAKITDNLSLQLDISSIVENKDFPARNMGVGGDMWQDYWNTMPYYHSSFPDPTKVPYADGAGIGGLNISSNSEISGYNKTDYQNLKGTIALNYNIKAIKGLSAKVLVNYLKNYTSNKSFGKPVNAYTYDPQSDIYTLVGTFGGTKASLGQSESKDLTLTKQFSLSYDNTFNKDHHLTALALYESINYNSSYLSANRINFLTSAIDQMFAGSTEGMKNDGSATEMGRKSYVGRINYAFKNKYLIESILRADASAKFPSSKRWGYFPSISFGWILSQENFMKQYSNIDNLKLRASYGQSGNDAVGNFQYLSGYNLGYTYILDATKQTGVLSTGLANPDLTWERIKISNIGLDFSFLERKLYGEVEAFYRERNGIPATQIATLPSTFGSGLPPVNLNSLNNRGFELSLGTSGEVNEIKYDISGNISWSRSKWDHYEEPSYTDPDQERIYKNSGRWTDRSYGYVSDGLFASQSEINALKFDQDIQGNKSLRPGDVRYKDMNNDGKLDWKDMIEIGKGTTPHWMVGFNANLKYKNFDLSALLQGAFGYYSYVSMQPVGKLYSAVSFNNRWTSVKNNTDALLPRIGGSSLNNLYSDFYYKKAGYLRLKTISLGYNLPKRLLDKISFSQARIYLAGINLLTFNKLSKFGLDPEAPNYGRYYPQQRTISVGANISF